MPTQENIGLDRNCDIEFLDSSGDKTVSIDRILEKQ
jgi:hypothetical protein